MSPLLIRAQRSAQHAPARLGCVMLLSCFWLSGCHWVGLGTSPSGQPKTAAVPPQDAVTRAQVTLEKLRTDRDLAQWVPIEMDDAERAINAAAHPDADPAMAEHQRYMAEKTTELACARAHERAMVARLQALAQSSGDKRLASANPQNQAGPPLPPPPHLSAPSPDSLKPAPSPLAYTSLNTLVLPDNAFSGVSTQLTPAANYALSGVVNAFKQGSENPAQSGQPGHPALTQSAVPSDALIRVRAYSSANADNTPAMETARAKAEAVRKALISLGVNVDQIDAKAQAELPVAGSTAAPRPPRVEVQLTRQTDPALRAD